MGDWLRGRAYPSHGWGHKFESCIAHHLKIRSEVFPLAYFIFETETKSDSKNKLVLPESLFLARAYARLPDEVFDATV